MMDPRDIVEFLRNDARRPLKAKELAAALRVPAGDFVAFRELLDRLEEEGVLYKVQRQRYAAPERINLMVGRLQTTRAGAGFMVPEAGGPDVFIPLDALNTAVDGDHVVVRVESRGRGDRPAGRVIRVLERARETVVGVFHPASAGRGPRQAAHGHVVPEDRKLPWDVYITPGRSGEAEDGDMVVVRITDWGSSRRGPAGEIDEVLGRPGEAGVDVLAIIRAHGLPTGFTDEVEQSAEALRSRGVTEHDLRNREDLRPLLVFTIDPADARDHDDAISIDVLPTGGWRVGVHIADVSHYVEEGSILDHEALLRGTSVYLVDRVVPMLPHPLSSDLCSLVPDADRLTLSLFVELSATGELGAQRLVRGVIRSRYRLSYEDAQAVLDGTGSTAADVDHAIREMSRVAGLLRETRRQRGSMDLDLPETRVVLAGTGEPTDIQRVVRLEAHRLIEDFMLLANEAIARRAVAAGIPFMYRIHEPPDESRMQQLREFLATLGHRLPGRPGSPSPRDLQRLLLAADGSPDQALVSTVVLRSMKQARYSEQNPGHFGLAAPTYTHFTSPIRRYPDLLVHRIATRIFIDGSATWLSAERISDVARVASERERNAVAAERDSKELKKLEFMQRHLGEEFEGTISAVKAFGFFVLLDDFFVEGLVHVSSMDDDYYLFLEEQFALVGERGRRRFRTGDRVRIRVTAVEPEERRIVFHLAPTTAHGREEKPSRPKAGTPTRRRRP